MTRRIYLDGCSYTYGLNLPRESTLAHRFEETGGYELTNCSRPGKSNMAMTLDTFKHYQDHDIIVVGWTYSSRFYLKYHDMDIDLLATRQQIELPYTQDSQLLEQTYQELHRQFYSLHDPDYFDSLSNMLVTLLYHTVKAKNKQVIFFSWERRDVDVPVYYPHVPANFRLPCGHLNANGVNYLYNKLQVMISE